MSSLVDAAIITRLSSNAPIVSSLATYRSNPAIFNTIVPPDAVPNWIMINQPTETTAMGSKNGDLYSYEEHRTFEIAAPKSGSRFPLITLSDLVIEEFHRAPLILVGSETCEVIEATQGLSIETDDFYGSVINLYMLIRKT